MRLSTNNYMSNLGKAALIALALLLPLAACSDDGGSTAPVTPTSEAASNTMAPTPMSQASSESMESEPISVVVTTNIVADWVENIGGEHVDVFSLVPVGADPHSFQPGAQDVAKVADAELVLSVGLGLEGSWLKDILRNAARDPSTIVELGKVVDPIEFGESHREEVEEGAEGEEDHEGHGHGIDDPHFWFDPLRVKSAVNDIATRLSVLDPNGGDTFSANASVYNARLDDLHTWTKEQVGMVPQDRRLLVTSHDSLGYFANLYGFEVVGVILSTTTEVEPSAADLADLIQEVEEYSVPAVFGETTVSERLAETVAAESGASVVRLHSGSLGAEGSGAQTYVEMVRTNVERIVGALR